MALPVRKGYKGAAANAVLTNSPTASSGDTTFTVDTVTGWSTTFPYFAVVDPGTSREEKVKVTAISTLTLTVVRAQDDTSVAVHSAGAAIYPVFTADEADEANLIASAMTTKGDLIATDGSSVNRLAIGTNTHVLQADSSSTNGFKWGQVATAGIADDAVTAAKIAAGSVAASELASDAVTTAKILDANVTLAKLATAVANALVPVGTIAMYGGAAAPTGWLLCNGDAIDAGYTVLKGIVGNNTPDFKGRFPIGDNGSLNLLGTGGSLTITANNLPAHSHPNTATASTSVSVSDPGHSHTIDTFDVATGGSAMGSPEPGYGASAGDEANVVNSNTTGITASATTTVTMTNANNTTTASDYYPPHLVVNYIIKHD
jgi:microcystin-dependent protein